MSITPENIAGLVVGEGCFYAESAPDGKYRLGWRIRPAFSIEMRYDERQVLEEVMRSIGCGALFDLDFGRYKGYEDKGWHPHVKYRVTRIGDLAYKVLPYFREHPLFGTKEQAFNIFAQLVEALQRREHRTPEGLGRAKLIAEELKMHNARGLPEVADLALKQS